LRADGVGNFRLHLGNTVIHMAWRTCQYCAPRPMALHQALLFVSLRSHIHS